ncbi:S-DNA-T family DNA segregation ATPase FtsK/SpoIIIE [Nakamurella sp. UYEF19]|uniref:FtsK/SpoIIIE domain-containing protein n=1 Tax=Nakamurella sp. UYEF19 TaxID=1756392 RepID=UPI0033971535
MTPFVLPLTLTTTTDEVDLLLDLPGPTSLSAVLPDLIRVAGLAPRTVLHCGAGPAEGSWMLGRAPLLAGTVLTTEPTDELVAAGPVSLSCIAGPDAGGWIVLGGTSVSVGRDPDCDLAVDDPELSRRHAGLRRTEAGVVVRDLRSVNGVLVDGVGRPRAHIDGDDPVPSSGLIRLGGSIFRAGLASEPTLLLTPDGVGHLLVARPARVAPSFRYSLRDPPGPAPERTRRPIPLLAALVGAALGVLLALVTGLWTFLLLAVLGPLMMLISSVSDRVAGRRSHRRALADHRADLADDRTDLAAAVMADRRDAWDRYPDPATLARRASTAGTRLWERRRDDEDFLRLSLGVGRRPARVARSSPPEVVEVPITVDLRGIGVLGICGDARPLLRQLVLQLATLHSPADLRLSVFSDGLDLARAADLPHRANDGWATLNPSDEPAASAEIGRLLASSDERVCVVLLDDAHRWRRLPGMHELLEQAARHHTAEAGVVESEAGRGSRGPDKRLLAICLSSTPEALPAECTAIVSVRAGRATITAGHLRAEAEVAGVSRERLEWVIRSLGPLVDPDAPGAGLPSKVLFAQLLPALGSPGSVHPVPTLVQVLATRWARPSLTAVLGMAAPGPLTVDLESDGPHVLIAGTTGSGKSELLATLIAGLAVTSPPDRVSFLLVDYKGGAAFGALAGLPHVAGLVTDLDAATAVRALTGLRAEVRRRERLLAEAGVADLTDLRKQAPSDCPPSLVIVVDEFATLGVELPEFLSGLLDVAQRGRSLGLHLVLATQRPAGVLSPAIRANIGLRICLRVTDDADSLDVIDTPAAAHLPVGLPGRAIVRRDHSLGELFQVASASSVPVTQPRVRLRHSPSAASEVPPLRSANPEEPRGEVPATDLDRVVAATTTAATGMARPLAPWLPQLPDRWETDDEQMIGLLDRPEDRQQTGWRVPDGSTLVLGRPGSGRSSTLRRFAWVRAASGSELLVVDAGDGLRDLARWPGCRTHLDGRDPSLVQRLVERLGEELRFRAEEPAVDLILLIDGWEVISGSLDTLDYGGTQSAVADLAARGPAAGIRVVLAGDLRWQHHRMAGGFAHMLRLGVDVRGEPRAGPPGRGWLAVDEIQVVHCPPGDPPPARPGRLTQPGVTRPVLAPMSGPPAPSGRHRATSRRPTPVIRPLPSSVDVAELGVPTAGALPLGRGGDDASTVSVDLSGPGGGFLIAGPRRSGVSTTLTVLALGGARAGIPVVRGTVQAQAAVPGVRDVDLRRGTSDLRQLLSDHQGPILLIADDLDRWSDDGSDLLERFLAAAGSAQYLALGSRLDRALRAHRGPIAEVAALRNGVLLQADTSDGTLLDVALPRRRGALVVGRGHLVVAGRAVPLQVAAVSSTT